MYVPSSSDILSLIKIPKNYNNALSDKLNILDFVDGILASECFEPYKKQILKKLSRFKYSDLTGYIFDIIVKKDFFPVGDIDSSDTEAISYSIPVSCVGYYGNYDADITIDDLTGMSTPEFVAAILFNYSSFIDFIDEDSVNGRINEIPDEIIRMKVLDLTQKYELKDVYRCFIDDVKGGRYRDNSFMKDLIYLFKRLCQDTNCGFVDCVPDMMQDPVSWENIDSLVAIWDEQKKDENRWIKFVKKLRNNEKFLKKFYKILFKIVDSYKTKKKEEDKNEKQN